MIAPSLLLIALSLQTADTTEGRGMLRPYTTAPSSTPFK